jgi:hypothetical protein
MKKCVASVFLMIYICSPFEISISISTANINNKTQQVMVLCVSGENNNNADNQQHGNNFRYYMN